MGAKMSDNLENGTNSMLKNCNIDDVVAYSFRLAKELCKMSYGILFLKLTCPWEVKDDFRILNDNNIKEIVISSFFHVWYRIYQESSEAESIYEASNRYLKKEFRYRNIDSSGIYHRITENIKTGRINSLDKIQASLPSSIKNPLINQMPSCPFFIDEGKFHRNTPYETDRHIYIPQSQIESLRLLYGKGQEGEYHSLSALLRTIIDNKLEDHSRYMTPNLWDEGLDCLETYYKDLFNRTDISIVEKSMYFYELEMNFRFETYFKVWEQLKKRDIPEKTKKSCISISTLLHIFLVDDSQLLLNINLINDRDIKRIITEPNKGTMFYIIQKLYWCNMLHEIIYYILKKQGLPKFKNSQIENSERLKKFCLNCSDIFPKYITWDKVTLFDDERNKITKGRKFIYPSDTYRSLLNLNYDGFSQDDVNFIFSSIYRINDAILRSSYQCHEYIDEQKAMALFNMPPHKIFC